jgi:hypothetical protein
MVMCWPHSDSWMQKAAQTDQRISDAPRDFMGDRVAAWPLARKKALEGAVMPLEYYLGICAEKGRVLAGGRKTSGNGMAPIPASLTAP